ncbi:MAG: hypothetical protein A2X99_06045 [Deltaproteobacteria bacterium GWB2_55_19]|nr:MAG: hypothetical protein A2X99_06045 [Deltaproteobacteria bacterium GWB2_55_19]HAO92536.1 hypothetical protein [Deltaproteobacteria bacterium]
MHAIDVSNVSKRFRRNNTTTIKEYIVRGLWNRRPEPQGPVWALKEVNLKVMRGAAYAVIGQNGSGKSTLLKIIAGIMRPDEGKVSVNGKVSALIELGAGFHPEFTGRENIYINGMLLGLTKKEIGRRIDDIIDFAGLRDFINEPVRTYSSGMYSKLGFAVAVNVDPDILLIDEVFAVGDEEFVHKCKGKMDEFKKRGKTILFVTHSLPTVEEWCDEAMWLEYGVTRAAGSSIEVSDSYKREIFALENMKLIMESEKTNTGLEDAVNDVPTGAAGGGAPSADALAAAQDGGGEPGRRWGSREVEITSVKLFDHKGVEKYVFSMGEPVTILMHYDAHKTVFKPVFGFALLRSDGVRCYGTNTSLQGISIGMVSGQGTIKVVVDEINLLGGQYFVDAAVHTEDGVAYDYHSQIHQMVIMNDEKDVGVCRLRHRWELPEALLATDGA